MLLEWNVSYYTILNYLFSLSLGKKVTQKLIFAVKMIGGGGCNPKKPNPYPRKGQTGIGFFWVFLGFLNIAILAERYAYFYFPLKSFELPQYIFVQSMTLLNIGLHGNT